MKEKGKQNKIAEQDVQQDGRKASGKRTRRANLVKKNNRIQSLTVKVAKHHNRRLSKKLKKKDITPSSPILSSSFIETPQASSSNSEDESPKDSPENSGIASPKTMVLTLWGSLSPATQKRSTRKMILSSSRSPMRKGMRKHMGKRIEKVVDSLSKKDELSQKVVNVTRDDETSMTCPDKKKEKLRYRLDYLRVFHEKFLSEYQVECSYSHFCKLVRNDIVRTKPQDWGTCLSQTFLNPLLKMQSLRNVGKPLFVETEKPIKYDESKVKAFCEKLITCKETVRQLYWSKGKKESKNSVTETYMSCKKVKCCSSQEFESNFWLTLRH